MRNWIRLIIAVGGSLLAGGIGSVFTASAIPTWYATLARPELSPPNWIFGPVWTTLYIMMGVAVWLVWNRRDNTSPAMKRSIHIALILFIVQLILNTLWSIIFFGSPSLNIYGINNIGIAFIEIILLWLAIAATIFAFAKISKTAAWLLVPYIVWVSFASYLTYAIWTLNPGVHDTKGIVASATSSAQPPLLIKSLPIKL